MKQELIAADGHLDELWLAANKQQMSSNRGLEYAARSDMVYKTLSTIERLIGI